MNAEKKLRFDLLDGLRGFAAIAVMVFHFTLHNGLHWLGGAWVAVDLFFVLSGFVIAHSYGAQLIEGMPFREFFLVRLIRLGPLYFFGLAAGLIATALPIAGGQFTGISIFQLATAAVLGALWLPYVNHIAWPFGLEKVDGPIFPLNDPAWSLFFEAFVNAIFFLYVSRYRKVSGVWLVAICASIFVLSSYRFQVTNPGWGTANFRFGFPRVIAEFFAGALIYRSGCHLKPVPAKFAVPVMAAALLFFFVRNDQISLLNSFTLIPLTVALASTVEVRGWGRAICRFLGKLSYPIYMIHFPMYRLLWQLSELEMLSPVAQTVAASGLCFAAAIALSFFDEKLRKLLMEKLLRGKTARLGATVRQPS